MWPPFFRKHLYHMQEAAQSLFCTLPGGKRAAVKTFAGGEVPFTTYAEKTVASERGRSLFAGSLLRLHGVSRARIVIRFGQHDKFGGAEPVLVHY